MAIYYILGAICLFGAGWFLGAKRGTRKLTSVEAELGNLPTYASVEVRALAARLRALL